MIRPPMLPCPSSGLQAPSVKIIHVSASGFPTLIGGELRTRSRKSKRLLLIESSKRFLPPLSTQNRPRFFTAALAVRPKVNPSKNIIRPLSLSASLASNQSSARMSLIFESNSLLRSSVCPITISLSSLPLRSISNPNILNFLSNGWNFFPSFAKSRPNSVKSDSTDQEVFSNSSVRLSTL